MINHVKIEYNFNPYQLPNLFHSSYFKTRTVENEKCGLLMTILQGQASIGKRHRLKQNISTKL